MTGNPASISCMGRAIPGEEILRKGLHEDVEIKMILQREK